MLMFTVLACSTGPSQAEFDALAEDGVNRGTRVYENEQQIKELKRIIVEMAEELSVVMEGLYDALVIIEEDKPKLVDFIVTHKVSSTDSEEGTPRGKIEYLAGNETKAYIWPKTSQCWKDAVIGAPLPLSCR